MCMTAQGTYAELSANIIFMHSEFGIFLDAGCIVA